MKQKIRTLVQSVTGYADKMEPLAITSSQNQIIIQARELVLETLEKVESTNDSKKLKKIMEHLDTTYCQIIQDLKLTPEIAETVEDRRTETIMQDARKASKDVTVKVKKKKSRLKKKDSNSKKKDKESSKVDSKKVSRPKFLKKSELEDIKDPVISDMIDKLSTIKDPETISKMVAKLMKMIHTLTLEITDIKKVVKSHGDGMIASIDNMSVLAKEAKLSLHDIEELKNWVNSQKSKK